MRRKLPSGDPLPMSSAKSLKFRKDCFTEGLAVELRKMPCPVPDRLQEDIAQGFILWGMGGITFPNPGAFIETRVYIPVPESRAVGESRVGAAA